MRFHREIGFPQFKAPDLLTLNYSQHALREANSDKYGTLNLPAVLKTKDADLFEAHVEGGVMTIGVYRMHHDAEHDMTLVVSTGDRPKVITVWANRKDDVHSTLRHDLYAVPACA